MRLFVAVALLLSVVWRPALASADEAADDEAREHYQRGLRFFEEDDDDAALVEFKEAYRLKPSYRLKYNIGQVYAALGRYAEAHRYLTEYLAEGGDEITAERRAEVERDLATIRERIGWLRVRGEAPGTRVVVDGAPKGTMPFEEPIALDVGLRMVEFEVAGQVRMKRQVEVAAGKTIEVEYTEAAEPAPDEEPGEEPESGEPAEPIEEEPAIGALGIAGIVGMGAGLVAVGVGAGFGAKALELEDQLHDACEGNACPPYVSSERREYDDKRLAADVLFGIGGALVVAGAAMLVVDIVGRGDEETTEQVRVGLEPMVAGATLSVIGEF